MASSASQVSSTPSQVSSTPEFETLRFQSLTVPQLVALCRTHKLSGYSKLKKAELVQKLETYRQSLLVFSIKENRNDEQHGLALQRQTGSLQVTGERNLDIDVPVQEVQPVDTDSRNLDARCAEQAPMVCAMDLVARSSEGLSIQSYDLPVHETVSSGGMVSPATKGLAYATPESRERRPADGPKGHMMRELDRGAASTGRLGVSSSSSLPANLASVPRAQLLNAAPSPRGSTISTTAATGPNSLLVRKRKAPNVSTISSKGTARAVESHLSSKKKCINMDTKATDSFVFKLPALPPSIVTTTTREFESSTLASAATTEGRLTRPRFTPLKPALKRLQADCKLDTDNRLHVEPAFSRQGIFD
ncbi:hypothetical protein FRC17_003171, partial [Serendipita sp. 399]